MNAIELLTDALGRIREQVNEVVAGLTPAQLTYQPEREANSISWLVWHLTRIQDDHIASAARLDQVWTTGGWFERFGLPFDAHATGFGQTPEEVAAFDVDGPDLLSGYHEATYQQTLIFLNQLHETDLDKVIDTSWTPPVTLGVRFVSVTADDLQHIGQAQYLRGLLSGS